MRSFGGVWRADMSYHYIHVSGLGVETLCMGNFAVSHTGDRTPARKRVLEVLNLDVML